jgi:hypothetical protein
MAASSRLAVPEVTRWFATWTELVSAQISVTECVGVRR